LYKYCFKTQCVNIRYASIKRGKTIRGKKGEKEKEVRKRLRKIRGAGEVNMRKKKGGGGMQKFIKKR
jgi:hypothetical protein